MAERMSVDKKDPVKDDSEDSMGSSPEAEHPTNNHNGNNSTTAQENQQPKRKGGRKPVRYELFYLPWHFSFAAFAIDTTNWCNRFAVALTPALAVQSVLTRKSLTNAFPPYRYTRHRRRESNATARPKLLLERDEQNI
jgi:hypothetical protein